MPTKRRISLDEAYDADEVSSVPWRHGRRATYLYEAPDQTHWLFTVDVHTEDGWQTYGEDIEATQAGKVERIITTWEPLP